MKTPMKKPPAPGIKDAIIAGRAKPSKGSKGEMIAAYKTYLAMTKKKG